MARAWGQIGDRMGGLGWGQIWGDQGCGPGGGPLRVGPYGGSRGIDGAKWQTQDPLSDNHFLIW